MANVLEPQIERPRPESSDRNFGLVFAAALTTIAFVPFLHHGSPRWWAFGVALVFAAAALVRPQILHWPNRAWLALGNVMHRVMSPLVMGAIFFLCITPIAWIMRRRGSDLLSLKRRPDLKSYWIEREASPPDAQSMKNQY
ncbi:MAG: SxtJ family membrane protein [Xanthobacteraceae bacterium]|nr:SxtJ family membrane protein [Xanthobacteraceae bacterium]